MASDHGMEVEGFDVVGVRVEQVPHGIRERVLWPT